MPIGKRSWPNSAQLLINLGPLLAPMVVTVPRIRPVTYLDLHSQLTAEQVRVQMIHLEQHVRCAIAVAYYERSLDLTARFERLRRWMLLIDDRRGRLALGARDQLQKAELHFRAGILGYEGMAWPHLTLHLFRGSFKHAVHAVRTQCTQCTYQGVFGGSRACKHASRATRLTFRHAIDFRSPPHGARTRPKATLFPGRGTTPKLPGVLPGPCLRGTG